MSYELRYDRHADCVLLTFRGRTTLASVREAAPEVARMCDETACRRVLNDMSGATIDVSFMELFSSPKIMDESRVSRKTKRALVVPEDFADADFLEIVTRNRGHNLMVFTDTEEARHWLLST